jgi:Ca2+-binding EF-hand superfamily protein
MRLKRLDTDNDGTVSLDEFMKPKFDRFATVDKNADGALEGAELTGRMQERSAHRLRMTMARLDANGDGKVTREEFENGARHVMRGKRFGHEGGRRFWRERGDAQAGSRAQDASPNAAGGAKPADAMAQADTHTRQVPDGGRGARRAQLFANLDANGDGVVTLQDLEAKAAANIAYAQKKRLHMLDKDRNGKVSREEFITRPKQRFADLDLDGDGKITASDLPPRMAERWQKSPDRK